jgi:Na+-driven multidrug efflux pump
MGNFLKTYPQWYPYLAGMAIDYKKQYWTVRGLFLLTIILFNVFFGWLRTLEEGRNDIGP